MSEPALEDYVKEIAVMWPDLSRKGEPEKARQSLIDMVEGEIERIRRLGLHTNRIPGKRLRGSGRSRRSRIARRLWRCRGEFVKYKGSVERGGSWHFGRSNARKADSDSRGLPPVPGKILARINMMGGRRRGGGRRRVAGRRAEDGGRRREEAGRRADGGGRRAESGGPGRENVARDQEGAK